MNRSSHTPISDELLSAYIDGLVTNEEKARVEAAVATDPTLAWELDSLRRTVELVRDLPPVPLPRSFALREEQVADVLAERRARHAGSAARPGPTVRPPVGAGSRSFWQELLAFFNSGNLLLRNAAAVAALFLVIVLVTAPPGLQARQTPALSSTGEFSAAASDSSTLPEDSAAPAAPAAPAPSQPESAAKAAPAPAEIAPAENESDVAAAPVAEIAAPPPLQSEAVAMENALPSAAMRSAPSVLDAPALGGPADGMGGGFESGPMAMPIVPEEMAPANESPFPAPGVSELPQDGGPQYSPPLPAESEANAPAVAESAADSPVVGEDAALKSAASEPATKQAEMPAREEVLVEPSPQELTQSGGPTWRLIQAGLGGLALLLGILWLRSRKTYP